MNPQLAQAAAEAEAALAAGRADAYDCMVAALGRAESGDRDGAQALFDRALAMEPRNPAVLAGLGAWHRREGRLRDAILACDAAIAAAPGYADAWVERAAAYAAGGSSAVARESYERAAALAPGLASAHAGVAAIAARDGDPAAARAAAAWALKLDPGNLAAAGALATVLLEGGEPSAARDLLAPRLEATPAGPDRPHALSLLGNACERLGDYPAAFDCYRRSKAEFAALHAPASARFVSGTRVVEAIIAGLDRVDPARWSVPAPAQPAQAGAHIFLMGYPRSGTTLVENVLASLPGVAAIEERPTFAAADARYLAGDEAAIAGGIAAFADLDEVALEPLRAAYLDKADAAGANPDAPHLVDMDPMKATRLPFIARLFPDARIVLMRRDPRDVVWSCFRTSFAPTSGTLEYTTLEGAARHYDAMMRLTGLARERLPLAFHEVRYEDLVSRFEPTTRALCDFAGIAWSDVVKQFDRTARRRGVGTASAAQVRKGLYDGRRQWEPFAPWLEPVLPILAPWIERFGYAA